MNPGSPWGGDQSISNTNPIRLTWSQNGARALLVLRGKRIKRSRAGAIFARKLSGELNAATIPVKSRQVDLSGGSD